MKSTCYLFKNDYETINEQSWITYFKNPTNYKQKDLDHFKLKNNLRLQNHFLLTFDKKNELECFQLCETTTDCSAASFSFALFKNGCFLFHEGFLEKDEPNWISFIKTSELIYLSIYQVWLNFYSILLFIYKEEIHKTTNHSHNQNFKPCKAYNNAIFLSNLYVFYTCNSIP